MNLKQYTKKINVKINQKVGTMVYLGEASGPVDNRGDKQRWCYFKCECGKKCIKLFGSVYRRGTQSCGCQWRVKLPESVAALNRAFRIYRIGAKIRGLPFNLTKQEVKKLIFAPCYYCGDSPSNVYTFKKKKYLYNGIDRVKNNCGYSKKNCVSCCIWCNRSKSILPINEFLVWISKIYHHRVKHANLTI